MNKRHSPLTDWGLQHVRIGENFTILDVGCGGGRTIQKLAALAANGKFYGVDYAKGSIAVTCATNAGLIARGRVAVVRASVSSLPFRASQFDLATAVETQYFWPDMVSDMKEIRRVLKPGGTLVVIAEAYKAKASPRFMNLLMKIFRMSYFSVDGHRELFSRAGYEAVEVFEERDRGWVCAMGKNPKS
jgi:ubiquinone/menaquinone biosynthesis C-methylase UbiE